MSIRISEPFALPPLTIKRSWSRFGFNTSVNFVATLTIIGSALTAPTGTWGYIFAAVFFLMYLSVARRRLPFLRRPRDLLVLASPGVSSPAYIKGEIPWASMRGAFQKWTAEGFALCLCADPVALASIEPLHPAFSLGDRLEIPFSNLFAAFNSHELVGDFAQPRDIENAVSYINLVASVSAADPRAAAFNAARVAQLHRRAFVENPGAVPQFSAGTLGMVAAFLLTGSVALTLYRVIY